VKRPLRLLTSLLLVVVMAALAVPLLLHLVPVIRAAVDPPDPPPPAVTPAAQVPPTAVPIPDVVGPLSPAAPAPDPALLGAELEAALQLAGPGDVAASVIDATGGAVLHARNATRLQPPASNIKLVTAAALMTHARADEVLTTSVVTSSTTPGALYLRGGGDVLLGSGASDPAAVVGRAGLGTLALDAAAALPEGSGPYSLYLDETLFSGATVNPTWSAGDMAAGEIAPVHPLAVNSAWLTEGAARGPRSQDPGLEAARTFAAALEAAAVERGITVGADVQRRAAPEGAEPLAAVGSAPLGEQMRRMLEVSDNYLAEALARIAASRSGRPASFGGATEVLSAAAVGLGAPPEGLMIGDAAGLSVRNAMSAEQLALLLRGLVTSGEPGLMEVVEALPVAGLSGTLSTRFTAGAAPDPGAGVVRAKTGTLNAVTGLSGHVVTADGRLLVFSFLAAGLDGNTVEAREAVDRAAAVLAGCGCR
jgi:D-alanyl-D-alanine carboxypeptidase/D-alanyl-D-alanine-endopeptidase (penicillin-binding protein 4)